MAHQNACRRGPRERSERGPSRRAFLVSQVTPGLKRRGLTTLGHCERPPTRVSRAERAAGRDYFPFCERAPMASD
ncbi:hypothetical protein TYRP_009991 [Tyrophagus putrescentiae]|nr:hypothetical protein TYRP_009991 [Tyrophagus putrescentiae]